MIEFIALLAILVGIGFFIVGSIGLLRLPDVFSRLHALAKVDNVGLALLSFGVALLATDPFDSIKVVLVWLLILAASSVSSHLIAADALEQEQEESRD